MSETPSSKRHREPRTLRQRAVALLARREFSRAELRKRLLPTGANSAEIDAVLDELCGSRLLSDARFAAALVHQKQTSYSRRAITHALREKGVDAEVSAAALSTLDTDELTTATALWSRRFGKPPADEREKARQVRFLVSRGYSHAIAFKVLRAAGVPADDPPA